MSLWIGCDVVLLSSDDLRRAVIDNALATAFENQSAAGSVLDRVPAA